MIIVISLWFAFIHCFILFCCFRCVVVKYCCIRCWVICQLTNERIFLAFNLYLCLYRVVICPFILCVAFHSFLYFGSAFFSFVLYGYSGRYRWIIYAHVLARKFKVLHILMKVITKPAVVKKKLFCACQLALHYVEGWPRIFFLLPWLHNLGHGVSGVPSTFPHLLSCSQF